MLASDANKWAMRVKFPYNGDKVNGMEGRNVFKFKEQQKRKFSSFHEVMGPILTVSQLFGYLPSCGVLERNCNNVYFKWTSIRVIYTILFLCLGTFEVILMIIKAVQDGISLTDVEVIMFYGFAVARAYTFLYLATKWKEIVVFWYDKERPFLNEPYTMSRFNLSIKVYLIGFVFFIFYLTEHLTFIGVELHDNNYQLTYCNVTSISFLNNYMRRERPHLIDILPYHWWIFPFFQWTITLMAFGWNFVDYFIISISLGLSTRFNQLNRRLIHATSNQMSRKFWLDIRVHYTNLVDLLHFIDRKIALLILISMLQKLFLIATKVFEAIRYADRPFLINHIYFYFYLFFMVFRTLMMLSTCSNIHIEAQKPLISIRNAPVRCWGDDIKRLSDLISFENISLTGCGFFLITRQLILTMTGTIVTFELVLLDRGTRGDNSTWCSYFENMTLS
ncbi:unnamed protein product [Chironomus riparius]|uniref:Gustatory receptor n=1 Tax=Chironomus riparius TaxID=315576 RepID=A0A9N9RZK9_9DIPT|nr:unnamed protein product [Chironomus riparius]